MHSAQYQIKSNQIVVTCSWFVVNDIYQCLSTVKQILLLRSTPTCRVRPNFRSRMRKQSLCVMLNLNLSSVGGRSLKLTDYYRAEARRYLPDRAETEARPCEAEARPSQLKKTASRPPRAEADASRTTSLQIVQQISVKSVNNSLQEG